MLNMGTMKQQTALLTMYLLSLQYLQLQGYNGQAFVKPRQSSHYITTNSQETPGRLTTSRQYVSVQSYDYNNDGEPSSSYTAKSRKPNVAAIRRAMANATDSLLSQEDDDEEVIISRRRQLRQAVGDANMFTVKLPLQSAENALSMMLVEVSPGKSVSNTRLDLNSLQMHTFGQDTEDNKGNEVIAAWNRSDVLDKIDMSFQGLIVASVRKDSLAWQEGVRPGDVLQAVSATLGDAVWPKSTLEGVRSALSSRRSVAKQVSLRFRALGEDVYGTDSSTATMSRTANTNSAVSANLNNQYTLTLRKPLGIEISEVNGFVTLTGFNDNACKMVKLACKVGDRVVAVDSTIGDQMWPVSTVEGVQSACAARLPGQAVTIRFERVQENTKTEQINSDTSSTATAASTVSTSSDAKSVVSSRTVATKSGDAMSSSSPPPPLSTAPSIPSIDEQRALLKRCRDTLRRYSVGGQEISKFKGKYAVPALVADKVIDAIASASVQIDSVTLCMIMTAYLSVKKPENAIQVFEAAVGLSADGSANAVMKSMLCKDQGCVVPNESALNLYTATALLKAHAQRGDLASVQRVLAALEGRSGVEYNGIESAPWPWTGPYGSIKIDTTCYNIAISAAERIGGEEALRVAEELFTMLPMPSSKKRKEETKFCRDSVTYNTMISLYVNEGENQKAFTLFEQMKRSGMKPDKYTYTSLIKACEHDGDVDELLYDMRAFGVQADVVTYNTVIKLLCDAKKWTQATRLITDMESRGIAPDCLTYSYLMNGMLKADKASATLSLFESACMSGRTSSLMNNIYLYTTAITAASVIGDYERALELVSRMKANGVKPNLQTLTAVVGACLSAKEYNIAAALYTKIDEPDSYAKLQGIRAYCGAGDVEKALYLLQDEKYGNGKKTLTGKDLMRSYELLICTALEEKDTNVAQQALADIFARGNIPSKAMMNKILEKLELDEDTYSAEYLAEYGNDHFVFLLYIADLFGKRNLPISGALYSTIVNLGCAIGGVPRRLSVMMMRNAKIGYGQKHKEIAVSVVSDGGDVASGDKEVSTQVQGTPEEMRWLDMLHNLSIDFGLDSDQKSVCRLSVQVSSDDTRKVSRAEQTASRWMKRLKSNGATKTSVDGGVNDANTVAADAVTV